MLTTIENTVQSTLDDPKHDQIISQDANSGNKFQFTATPGFRSWLAEQKASLAFSTYQTGKIFFIGLQPNGRLSVYERTFNRCMGLCASADTQTIFLSDLYQCWRFENALKPGEEHQGYDRLYVPQMSYTTGDIDIHDIVLNEAKQPIFVSTLFSCLATVSPTASFEPLWKPHFISKLAAEDRCHLNGLAMENDKPRFVTAVSETDAFEAWRDHRQTGGIVMDVEKNTIVVKGLSMPHSPRLYQDKLWLINSGTGYFGYIDFKDDEKSQGEFVPMSFCSGYARGLGFINNFAVVGVSKQRDNSTFKDLQLDRELGERDLTSQCTLLIIDLTTGEIIHGLDIEGTVEELYDVIVLPQVIRPMALGFKTDEIRRMITMGDVASLRKG